jgi:hypothetical protein
LVIAEWTAFLPSLLAYQRIAVAIPASSGLSSVLPLYQKVTQPPNSQRSFRFLLRDSLVAADAMLGLADSADRAILAAKIGNAIAEPVNTILKSGGSFNRVVVVLR